MFIFLYHPLDYDLHDNKYYVLFTPTLKNVAQCLTCCVYSEKCLLNDECINVQTKDSNLEFGMLASLRGKPNNTAVVLKFVV